MLRQLDLATGQFKPHAEVLSVQGGQVAYLEEVDLVRRVKILVRLEVRALQVAGAACLVAVVADLVSSP